MLALVNHWLFEPLSLFETLVVQNTVAVEMYVSTFTEKILGCKLLCSASSLDTSTLVLIFS